MRFKIKNNEVRISGKNNARTLIQSLHLEQNFRL